MSSTRAGEPFAGQGLGRVEGRGDHQAVGDDRQVGAVAELVGLADLERGRAAGVDARHFGPADAEIDRPLVLEHRRGRGLGRLVVGRHDHHEAGQRTGQGDVLDAHLGRAILADRDARRGCPPP